MLQFLRCINLNLFNYFVHIWIIFSWLYSVIWTSWACEPPFTISCQPQRQTIVQYYLHWTTTFEIYFSGIAQTQTKASYWRILPTWTTTFEISFSGSSDTNHGSLLKNTTYTGPPRLRHLFQVVQTQITAAYWRILPTLNPHVWDIFFR